MLETFFCPSLTQMAHMTLPQHAQNAPLLSARGVLEGVSVCCVGGLPTFLFILIHHKDGARDTA